MDKLGTETGRLLRIQAEKSDPLDTHGLPEKRQRYVRIKGEKTHHRFHFESNADNRVQGAFEEFRGWNEGHRQDEQGANSLAYYQDGALTLALLE